MRLTHLSLTNFRNYTRLELDVPDRITVFQGANAQGKTNLLEAVHLLSTGRSPRAVAERELVNWLALESALPYARLVAEVGSGRDAQKLEMVLELSRNGGTAGPVIRKQVRIDGVPKRGIDLVGRLRVVLFLPEDVNLVAGTPGERRRYLDIALCQIDPAYCRVLAEYNKVLGQRNALLRRLRDEGGDSGQLGFWDSQISEQGGTLLVRRARALESLDRIASERNHDLTRGAERLRLAYLPSPDPLSAARRGPDPDNLAAYARMSPSEMAGFVLAQLRLLRPRDIASGVSLCGPHRDDMVFLGDGHDLRVFGSRGQQRTAALAVKLAELTMMREITGESPLLLLDDVMSELDAVRRAALLEALAGVEQALVTTTDWGDFSAVLLANAQRLRIDAGRVSQA